MKKKKLEIIENHFVVFEELDLLYKDFKKIRNSFHKNHNIFLEAKACKGTIHDLHNNILNDKRLQTAQSTYEECKLLKPQFENVLTNINNQILSFKNLHQEQITYIKQPHVILETQNIFYKKLDSVALKTKIFNINIDSDYEQLKRDYEEFVHAFNKLEHWLNCNTSW